MVCRDAGCRVRVVMLYRRIHRRHGHGDQFSGARDVGFAGGGSEQPVVADAMSAALLSTAAQRRLNNPSQSWAKVAITV
jgi:hypothetical protein